MMWISDLEDDAYSCAKRAPGDDVCHPCTPSSGDDPIVSFNFYPVLGL